MLIRWKFERHFPDHIVVDCIQMYFPELVGCAYVRRGGEFKYDNITLKTVAYIAEDIVIARFTRVVQL